MVLTWNTSALPIDSADGGGARLPVASSEGKGQASSHLNPVLEADPTSAISMLVLSHLDLNHLDAHLGPQPLAATSGMLGEFVANQVTGIVAGMHRAQVPSVSPGTVDPQSPGTADPQDSLPPHLAAKRVHVSTRPLPVTCPVEEFHLPSCLQLS